MRKLRFCPLLVVLALPLDADGKTIRLGDDCSPLTFPR